MSEDVELFTTSILSHPVVRGRHNRYVSALSVLQIPFVIHDLASDQIAKSRWRRKAPDPQIPGLLVRGEWRGSFAEFEEAVENGEVQQFLGLDAQAQCPRPGKLPAARLAPPGSGARAEPDADEMLFNLLPQGETVTDAQVDELLKELEKPLQRTPRRTYVPSNRTEALPLANMGTRGGPVPTARFNDERNLVEEAAKAIGVAPRPRGAAPRMRVKREPLHEILAKRRQRQSEIEYDTRNDELFASLGISNVKLSDEQVESFLSDGKIPILESGESGAKPSAPTRDDPGASGPPVESDVPRADTSGAGDNVDVAERQSEDAGGTETPHKTVVEALSETIHDNNSESKDVAPAPHSPRNVDIETSNDTRPENEDEPQDVIDAKREAQAMNESISKEMDAEDTDEAEGQPTGEVVSTEEDVPESTLKDKAGVEESPQNDVVESDEVGLTDRSPKDEAALAGETRVKETSPVDGDENASEAKDKALDESIDDESPVDESAKDEASADVAGTDDHGASVVDSEDKGDNVQVDVTESKDEAAAMDDVSADEAKVADTTQPLAETGINESSSGNVDSQSKDEGHAEVTDPAKVHTTGTEDVSESEQATQSMDDGPTAAAKDKGDTQAEDARDETEPHGTSIPQDEIEAMREIQAMNEALAKSALEPRDDSGTENPQPNESETMETTESIAEPGPKDATLGQDEDGTESKKETIAQDHTDVNEGNQGADASKSEVDATDKMDAAETEDPTRVEAEEVTEPQAGDKSAKLAAEDRSRTTEPESLLIIKSATNDESKVASAADETMASSDAAPDRAQDNERSRHDAGDWDSGVDYVQSHETPASNGAEQSGTEVAANDTTATSTEAPVLAKEPVEADSTEAPGARDGETEGPESAVSLEQAIDAQDTPVDSGMDRRPEAEGDDAGPTAATTSCESADAESTMRAPESTIPHDSPADAEKASDATFPEAVFKDMPEVPVVNIASQHDAYEAGAAATKDPAANDVLEPAKDPAGGADKEAAETPSEAGGAQARETGVSVAEDELAKEPVSTTAVSPAPPVASAGDQSAAGNEAEAVPNAPETSTAPDAASKNNDEKIVPDRRDAQIPNDTAVPGKDVPRSAEIGRPQEPAATHGDSTLEEAQTTVPQAESAKDVAKEPVVNSSTKKPARYTEATMRRVQVTSVDRSRISFQGKPEIVSGEKVKKDRDDQRNVPQGVPQLLGDKAKPTEETNANNTDDIQVADENKQDKPGSSQADPDETKLDQAKPEKAKPDDTKPESKHRRTLSEIMREADEILMEWS